MAGDPAWTQLIVPGAPSARDNTSAVYDSLGDRMIVFGGFSDALGEGNASWALSLSGTPTWKKLDPTGPLPMTRGAHVACLDAARNRMFAFGGFTPGQGINTVHYDDTWSLALVPPVVTGVPPAAPRAFALQWVRPNPAVRDVNISFALAEPGPATLELVDVTGRRLLSREVGELGLGEHVLRLDRDLDPLTAGVYWVALRQGPRLAARGLFLVR